MVGRSGAVPGAQKHQGGWRQAFMRAWQLGVGSKCMQSQRPPARLHVKAWCRVALWLRFYPGSAAPVLRPVYTRPMLRAAL